MSPQAGTHKQPRSAVTGRFVSWWYAARHKATTVVQTIRNGGKR